MLHLTTCLLSKQNPKGIGRQNGKGQRTGSEGQATINLPPFLPAENAFIHSAGRFPFFAGLLIFILLFLSLSFFNSKATKPQVTSPKRVIWKPVLSGVRCVRPGILVVSK